MTFYRRNLPHWIPDGRVIFLTFRLYGSLPRGSVTLDCAEKGRSGYTAGATTSPATQDWFPKFEKLDAQLDLRARGPLWLADPEIADYAEYPIIRGAELRHYELHAFVIMPNHVHILLEPHRPLAKITGAIKGVAARDANATLDRTGKPFWQDESFDHWVRDSAEFERIRHYIEWNPVKANLVAKPEDWKWSSVHPEWRTWVARRTAMSGCAPLNGAKEQATYYRDDFWANYQQQAAQCFYSM